MTNVNPNPHPSFTSIDDAFWSLLAARKQWCVRDPIVKLTCVIDIQRALHANSNHWAESCNKIYQERDTQMGFTGYNCVGLFGRQLQMLRHTLDLSVRKRYGYLMPSYNQTSRDIKSFRAFPDAASRAETVWLPHYNAELLFKMNTPQTQGTILERTKQRGCVVSLVPTVETMCCPIDILNAIFVHDVVVALALDPDLIPASHLLLYKKVFHTLIAPPHSTIAVIETKNPVAVVRNTYVEGHMYVGQTSRQFYQLHWGSQSSDKAVQKETIKRHVSILGGVPTYTIAPCKYTDEQLKHIARHLAFHKIQARGTWHHSPQLYIVASYWKQRENFAHLLIESMRDLRQKLLTSNVTRAISHEDRFTKSGVNAVRITDDVCLVRDVSFPSELTHTEARAMILGEVTIKCDLLRDFWEHSKDFLNSPSLMGSTCASLFVAPQSMNQLAYDVEMWTHQVNMGTISINCDASRALWLPQLRWGSLAGCKDDIRVPQSGHGFLNNFYHFDHPWKSVLRSRHLVWPMNETGRSKLIPLRMANYTTAGPLALWRTPALLLAYFVGI
eukprot:PhF_6_TR9244/c0_g1_i1/m.14616